MIIKQCMRNSVSALINKKTAWQFREINSINFQISGRCNLRCSSCYLLQESKDAFIGQAAFVDLKLFESVLKRYDKASKIAISGGEPLLHPELAEIIKIARVNIKHTSIVSNGILIKDNIDTIKNVNSVKISIDSWDYDSWAEMRCGSLGQYQSILESLRCLRDVGVDFTLNFVLHTSNFPSIVNMIDFGIGVGAKRLVFQSMSSLSQPVLSLSNEYGRDLITIYKEIVKRTNWTRDIVFPVVYDEQSNWFIEQKCSQPWSSLVVSAGGDIHYCCHLQKTSIVGNFNDGYHINRKNIRKVRSAFLSGRFPSPFCKYCHRRFDNTHHLHFDSTEKKWILPKWFLDI